jgi:hypothetical protein
LSPQTKLCSVSQTWPYKAKKNRTCYRSTYLRSCVWALLWSAETSNTDLHTYPTLRSQTYWHQLYPLYPGAITGMFCFEGMSDWGALSLSALLENYVLCIITRWRMITGNRATTFAAGLVPLCITLVPLCITLVLANKSKQVPYSRLYLSCSVVVLLVKHGTSFKSGSDTVFCGSNVGPSIRRNKRP